MMFVVALLVSVWLLVCIIGIRIATDRQNKKLREQGKKPVPEQEIVNVIDWTRK